jgi:penicillin amidase
MQRIRELHRMSRLLPSWVGLALLLTMPLSQAFASESPDALVARAKGVLAQLAGTIQLPGLEQPVEVLRDQWGVPHIYAQSQRDLFFAQGFVAAQDRLFQLDLWRRIGRGETAQIFGEDAIEADRFSRLVLYRGDMQAEWQSYSPDAREIITAFTEGINACIDHVTAAGKLPIEFQLLGYQPQKWQPEDVLTRMSGIIMVSNWQREVARARLIARVGAKQAWLIAPTDPPRDYALDEALDPAAITRDLFRGYLAATRVLKFQPSPSESNNWVVDGTLSASGKPLLASDPHRPITLPSLRYLVHLHAPGWNAIGSGEPALPGIALGHNEHVAWGLTIVGTDQADLYVESVHPKDSRQYKVGDCFEPMTVVRESLRVRGRNEPLELELLFTRHGPVIHQDDERRLAFALKWAGAEPGGAAYLGGLAVARANNRQQFLKSLESWKVPGLNFVYADTAGEIGWVAAAATPIRNNGDGLLPVPGADGRYEWQGYLPIAELPQSFNPPSHWLATANQNILPAGYTKQIAFEWSAPYRHQRIVERLSAGKRFTLEDFALIQHDSTALPARALEAVLREVELPAELADYAGLLRAWDGDLARDSRAGPLYAAWIQALVPAFYDERLPKDPLDRAELRSLPVVLAHLTKPDEAWFGGNPVAARDELVRSTFAAAVAKTKQLQGNDPRSWRWGMLHTATFEHPLASLSSAHARAFNLAPVERAGDGNTPLNTRHDETFRQLHGATYRHIFDLADWDRGLATSAPGQSGQPGSPHYADLLPLWAEGKYFPLVYSRAKVEAATRHRLRLVP